MAGSDSTRLPVISTIPEKCKRCYTCVRECPARAIKVEDGQAVVIEERCIACGNCVKVCAQHAKRIRDSIALVRRLLSSGRPVFACLAPSFPAAFEEVNPGQVITALRALGFQEVWEVAFGAELISREYAELFKEAQRTKARVIATACPAIVSYVEKYMPALRPALAPIVSPLLATARAIRHVYPDARTVFVGPCTAKKNEIHEPSLAGYVDGVLTYPELRRMLEEEHIELSSQAETRFDSPACDLGRALPISGGLLKAAGFGTDILESDIITTEGKERALEALRELESGKTRARFFDLLLCEGCINGPMMTAGRSMFARKDVVVDYLAGQERLTSEREVAESLERFKGVDLRREFSVQDVSLPQPTEEEIAAALHSMKKMAPEDQLNCGACGYPTCREKAIAVCQGLAEASMCLPYLIDELEDTCGQLQQSHRELESAQQKLVHTERLASMGQLSAGVAHELNNPLGTVLIYSHMLLRQMKGDSPERTDLEMIVSEATRCKNIVRGLLDFARKSRVSKAPTDWKRVVEEVRAVMDARAKRDSIGFAVEIGDSLPIMNIDGDQIKQMLINLIVNAFDAVDGKDGQVHVRTWLREEDGQVVIQVSDNGAGIAPEHVDKLFTPFFTTKELGKGTGLGLAIAYGIVKMHSGDIRAESELGKGTMFTVSIPVGQAEAAPAKS